MSVQLAGFGDEILSVDKISWNSPVVKSLLDSEVEDVIELKTPTGEEKIEILEIKF